MEHAAPKKIDRRQVRTKRRIRDAFMELISEKPMEKLTIKELAERADIDRKTFYLHYDSIAGLVDELQGELLHKLEDTLGAYDLFQPDFDALGFFRRINALIEEDTELHRRMITADGYRFFYDKLKRAMKGYLAERYQQRLAQSRASAVKRDLYAEYVTSGIVAVYVEWLRHPEYDLEEVAEAASEIAYDGMRAAIARI